jgi:hypothetical protein
MKTGWERRKTWENNTFRGSADWPWSKILSFAVEEGEINFGNMMMTFQMI